MVKSRRGNSEQQSAGEQTSSVVTDPNLGFLNLLKSYGDGSPIFVALSKERLCSPTTLDTTLESPEPLNYSLYWVGVLSGVILRARFRQ